MYIDVVQSKVKDSGEIAITYELDDIIFTCFRTDQGIVHTFEHCGISTCSCGEYKNINDFKEKNKVTY